MVQHLLSLHTGDSPVIERNSPVGGGCINDARKLETTAGTFFLKYNDARRYPRMFAAEARGLNLLAKSGALRVPRLVACADADGLLVASQDGVEEHPLPGDTGFAGPQSMLLLEYIEAAPQSDDFWDAFGAGLAGMHRHAPADGLFGLDHDNYIGSLHQSNRQHEGWIDFFVTERLEVQLRMARDQGRAGRELTRQFEALYPHLPDFFPEEPPALLHGDLWSGNFMTGDRGEAVIIDPAVHYGHRYMDLGMSRLFGGFSKAFYQSYQDAHPMEKNWEEAMDIANLYPLMVHVNLFGGGYAGSVKSILRRFS